MNKMSTDWLCIYHKNCNDGFAAALVVKKYCDDKGIKCDFYPDQYNEKPPEIDGKRVIIVDFSYPRNILEGMSIQADKLVVLDHHESAEKELRGLPYCIFDNTKSGAMLAWNYFFPRQIAPMLIRYVQDRDLWHFELESSREISAALSALPKKFEEWHYYLDDKALFHLVEPGRRILQYQREVMNKTLQNAELVEIADHTVPCVNATNLISELGNELAVGHPFAVIYFDSKDSRIFCLRSDRNGINVSKIAKKFGGGGHKHAAGFKVPKPSVNLA